MPVSVPSLDNRTPRLPGVATTGPCHPGRHRPLGIRLPVDSGLIGAGLIDAGPVDAGLVDGGLVGGGLVGMARLVVVVDDSADMTRTSTRLRRQDPPLTPRWGKTMVSSSGWRGVGAMSGAGRREGLLDRPDVRALTGCRPSSQRSPAARHIPGQRANRWLLGTRPAGCGLAKTDRTACAQPSHGRHDPAKYYYSDTASGWGNDRGDAGPTAEAGLMADAGLVADMDLVQGAPA